MAFLWGLICMSIGFVNNFAQFVSLRAILGLAEGGLFPGMVGWIFTQGHLEKQSSYKEMLLLGFVSFDDIYPI